MSALAMIRLHEHADREAAEVIAQSAGGCPYSAFKFMTAHACSAADCTFGYDSARSRIKRSEYVVAVDMEPVDVVQHAVIGFRDNRHHPENTGTDLIIEL